MGFTMAQLDTVNKINLMYWSKERGKMPEIIKEILWTILTSMVVYVLSQLLFELWIKPLQKYMDIKCRVSNLLVMYAPYYSNEIQLADENSYNKKKDYEIVSNETRKLAAEIREVIEIMPIIHMGIPSKKKLYEASRNLISLSNRLWKPYIINDRSSEAANKNNIKKIKENLDIFYYERK